MANFETTKTGDVVTLKCTEEDAYYKGTELSKKVIKEVFDHTHAYLTSKAEEAAVEATKVMEDDSDINKVIVTYPYSPSKRGELNIVANRSQTFRSPTDGSEVIKSTLKVVVKDPFNKVSKTTIRGLTGKMTESLLS
jgi:hypothetical protein